VDLYRVKAHLHELARVIHGEGTPEARASLCQMTKPPRRRRQT